MIPYGSFLQPRATKRTAFIFNNHDDSAIITYICRFFWKLFYLDRIEFFFISLSRWNNAHSENRRKWWKLGPFFFSTSRFALVVQQLADRERRRCWHTGRRIFASKWFGAILKEYLAYLTTPVGWGLVCSWGSVYTYFSGGGGGVDGFAFLLSWEWKEEDVCSPGGGGWVYGIRWLAVPLMVPPDARMTFSRCQVQ